MKSFGSAYKAAKAYAATSTSLQRDFDKDCNAFIVKAARFGILKETKRGWIINLPEFNRPTGWFIFDGNVKVEGPYDKKRNAVAVVGKRCGLTSPPRMTRVTAGMYSYVYEGENVNYELARAHEYLVVRADVAHEKGWL
jgi:hypothetical protein